MTTNPGKPRSPFRERAATWFLVLGAGAAAGAVSALLMSHPRYWPASHLLDCVIIGVGVIAAVPWCVMAARERSWWRAYRKGRVTRDQYKAYRSRRTGWPRTADSPEAPGEH